MGKQQGRKALIVLSDGVDRGSKETLASAVAAAQRANTLVYSILFADEHPYGGGCGGRGMGGMAGTAAVGPADTPSRSARMARKSSTRSPGRQAVAFLNSR